MKSTGMRTSRTEADHETVDHAAGQDNRLRNGALSPYVGVDDAAARLSTTPNALRARCRRNARRDGRAVSAHLGGGIVAIKFGVSWRIRFPD